MESPPVTDARRPGLADRWRAALAVRRARRAARRAQADERRALEELGRALSSAPGQGGALLPGADEVASGEARLAWLEAALARSLEEDRADYALASAWARPAVIARGLAARAVLRDRRARARRERAEAWARLGATALEAPHAGDGLVAARIARDARAAGEAARAEVERALAPLGGALAPPPASRVGHELAAFGRSLGKELRGQLFPRLPALAGLVVGWCLASTFTDSQLSATLHRLGIGSGPRHAVSSETYRAMSFWLPLLAAALCSYAGGRLGAFVRARYAPLRSEQEPPAAAAPGGPPAAGGPG